MIYYDQTEKELFYRELEAKGKTDDQRSREFVGYR